MSQRTENPVKSANEEVNADTQILLSTIDGMLNIITTQANLYNETRKKLVEQHLKKKSLGISDINEIYLEPTYSGPDLKLLGKRLHILGDRIKQMNEEKLAAQRQTENAFRQLNEENARLRKELADLRKGYIDS